MGISSSLGSQDRVAPWLWACDMADAIGKAAELQAVDGWEDRKLIVFGELDVIILHRARD
jgi:hypothetical protein